ncbi:COX15/CtaA family protein [Vulgatibacter incomptus]|uniref:Heme A synthase, cytochrome oxidase biogenesis protein Cox15-CtaA n=1 Tax=Vulgatibacter incomptus TaxID=1391653 RepID=A0A0K1PGH9_9BACT|nr:COX15/CtaA family protein [Vulgatibacter incomptus]AKU92526.1 Heme A synthase, cytochrome oxidase biogenesis protein Cox15-CtaA [Vulgatibacter incomptus]
MKEIGFRRLAWANLAYNLGVIAWGAYVRATGSGAGCGEHWPLCNGVPIPRAPAMATLIEFTHRLTSGVALLLVILIALAARRIHPRGHPARLGAALSLGTMILEALLGAGLVLLGLVEDNDSVARAIAMSLHLLNTLLLLGALTLTAWWASGGPRFRLRGQGVLGWTVLAGLAAMMVLGASGAVTALGDTLYPAGSLREGMIQDFSPTAHFLVRLRVLHPLLALGTGGLLLFVSVTAAIARPARSVRLAAISLCVLFVAQLGAGLLNLVLLAPVWMQLVHLLLADLVWIALVLLSASALSARPRESEESSPALA